jgi:hypothetical protein
VKTFDEIAAMDASVEAIWRRSWIGRSLQSFVCRLQIAWLDSWCRRTLAAVGIRW